MSKMYQSRLHATNGIVSIALDARSGEILEIVNEISGDNVVKSNCHPCQWMPFQIELPEKDRMLRAHPARFEQIHEDSSLAAIIDIRQLDSSAEIHVDYPCIVAEDIVYPVRVHMDITLPEGDWRSVWTLRIETDGIHEIGRVFFPCINGLWLGDTWTDDTLVLPYVSGAKYENPVRALSTPGAAVMWKWQEYNRVFKLDPNGAPKDERGSHYLEFPYSGPASMLWMDLFDRNENTGIYLTCRDDDFRFLSIRAETFGENEPGMGLSILHNVYRSEGEWTSQTCILGLHTGDWHTAADDYRKWRGSHPDNPPGKRFRPEWFDKSAGLMAHYDFKYQTQGIVHTFHDIPGLLDQAMDLGINHLLLSGWNCDGFDNGFPQYWTDPDLGSEEDLKEALKTVRKKGGHVAFYLNSRLCNTRYADRADLIRNSTIMDHNGRLKIEHYGSKVIEFACLCNQSASWEKEFTGRIAHLIHDVGADSMYLDQLAMTAGQLCFHPDHTEHAGRPDRWNDGYRKMLADLRESYGDDGVAMLYEGCSDIYGWGVAGQLISTLFRPQAYPEVYRYTFPDEILMDMMNPNRNSGMRAETVGQKSTFVLYRAFADGMYFWIYDLEYDNTFRRDPDQYERLKKTIALRKSWLERYGQGRFLDERGLTCTGPEVLCRRFALPEGTLLTFANPRQADNTVTVRLSAPIKCAKMYRMSDPETPVLFRPESCSGNSGTEITFSFPKNEELAFAVFE